MNESLFELLRKVTLFDLICTMCLMVIIIGILVSQKKRILRYLNKWRKTKNDEEDFNYMVYNLKNSVEEINNTLEQIFKNREHDREDSRRIRSEMYVIMDKQSESIDHLTQTVMDIQKKNSKTKRAEIKEKIERIYSECHLAMTCTDMQYETLKELIEEYEEHGGNNSFVHTTVEPEMHLWEKITRIKPMKHTK